jgi:hypothetical protein
MGMNEDFELSEGQLNELSKGHGEYYVYCFAERSDDPERSDGKLTPFYVGKGKGDRVKHDSEGIKEMEAKGKQAEKWFVHIGLTEAEALAAEEALINFSQDILGFELDNKVSGKNHTEAMLFENVGKFSDYEVIEKSDIKTDELILVVQINSAGLTGDDLKYRTLHSWKIGADRRDKIKYVVGVEIGSGKSVVSAYEVDDYEIWEEGTALERTAFISKSNSEKILDKLGLNKKRFDSKSQNFWYING